MKILLCPLSDGGYLYPAIAAGRELRRRGHDVDVLGRSTAAAVAADAGLPFAAAEDFGGRRAFSATWWGPSGAAQYRAIVRAARVTGADALVTSVLCTGALLAAETLDIPVVVVGLSVHLWDYRSGGEGEPQLGRTRDSRTRDCLRFYTDLREQAGLAGRASRWGDGPLLGDALLLRGDPELEFPGARLPERVRQVGPLSWEPRPEPAEVEAVDEHLRRSGKPVVYVHLGRFFEGKSLWPRLNEAFTGGRFQAVVEQGRSTDPRPAPDADILLVRRRWMGPLVDRAGLVLSNGTSAPVLAALLRGLPLALSPNGSEQPLLTGACLRAGVAVHFSKSPSVGASALLESAWRDDALRARARALGDRLAAMDGPAGAADVVERLAGAAAPSPTRAGPPSPSGAAAPSPTRAGPPTPTRAAALPQTRAAALSPTGAATPSPAEASASLKEKV
ncbi:glycosyltransferase [Streptomyces sp. NPDC005017]|uniref:glycosyltransferase n=1 Tax=Streptomyces sp. NPDC005017 TaxID=3364706 RepID=UPI0036A8BA72